MTKPLYVLEDSLGRVSCCAADPLDLWKECSRISLLVPVTVHHWVKVNSAGPHGGWKRVKTFSYDGLMPAGARRGN